MSVGVRVDLGPLRAKLDKVIDVVGDTRGLLEVAGNEALRMVAERFQREGPGWPALSSYTIERRRNEDKGSIKMLQDTGRLRNSIVAPESSPGGVYELTDTTLTIGSNLVYAAIHQYGWPAGGKHPPPTIPARPYLPDPVALINRVHDKLSRHLKENL